ncbi:STAS domain-containing protein [Sutcliffiella deserti]|uniref:STAS domain-containing protein n=1 Tax=Sutcliffiella deserti TaxID=2875501 RepID=UPI001CBC4D4D|nr:STAS domain-containing protein [Sutcliffiella deserti]
MTTSVHIEIGNKLEELYVEFSEQILSEIKKEHPDMPQYDDPATQEQIKKVFQTLIKFVGSYVKDPENKVLDEAKSWGESVGFMSVQAGGSLEKALSNMTLYKRCFWNFIEKEGSHAGIQLPELTEIFIFIDEIFNIVVYGFSHAFTLASEQKFQETRTNFIRLSIPIVPLFQGLGVLPLVGEIDDLRASILIEETLQKSKDLSISKLIVDFSGVYKLDETVLHTIDLLIRSLKLIGITPIITGLRPELSLQFISTGVSLTDIQITGSIEQILQEITN